jgi:hypothetical protein
VRCLRGYPREKPSAHENKQQLARDVFGGNSVKFNADSVRAAILPKNTPSEAKKAVKNPEIVAFTPNHPLISNHFAKANI